MVYKVSKCGVRSGNTLRNLRSERTRRYTRQGCMVGRSNLSQKEIPKVLDSDAEDTFVSSSLESTDVALSLNKKKRWLLPSAVGHMIKTGSFSEDKTMVSLLERHKLKRKANCVSFLCNQGRIRQVVPKEKRYFNFNVENIDKSQSNREKKRQKAEMLKEAKPVKKKLNKHQINGPVKTVDVFTVTKRPGKPVEVKKHFVSSKPEYRLEVLYPCPQTCSLTYNPKYTNAHMEFSEDGTMELKSEKRVLKKGGRQRKRFTLKDLEIYDPEIVSSDTEEFWDNDIDDLENEDVAVKESDASLQEREDNLTSSIRDSLEKYEHNYFHDEVSAFQENENIIAILVAQAEKARSLCENSLPRHRRKKSRKFFADQSLASNSNEKSHIVYTNEINPKLQNTSQCEKTVQTTTKTNYPSLYSAKVILKSVDAAPGNLRAKFGRLYAEAESEPRRFMIDVTEDIQNLLCPYRETEKSAAYTSFLVFIHDGVYDEGLNTYRMIFNSNCCTESEVIKCYIPFEETTFEEIMNRVASLVLDMKEENKLDFNTDQFCGSASISLMKFANDLFNVNVMAFRSGDEIRRVSQTEVMQENVDFFRSLESVTRNVDFEIFCDICYENINPTQTLDKYGTKLSTCSHNFCDECWRTHFRTKLMDGSVKMMCPGYNCDQKVRPVTLLSLLHVSEVCKLFQRMCEEEADSSSNSRWCPNRGCGLLIKLDIERSTDETKTLDVTCSCGKEFCFSCLSKPHWPATCEQAEKYADKLNLMKPVTKSTNNRYSRKTKKNLSQQKNGKKNKFLTVEGRLCPKCSKFIEKNGGCYVMHCKCGHCFCWNCLQDFSNHSFCLPKPSVLYEATVKLKVRHLVIPSNVSVESEAANKTKEEEPPQKTTLYKKAMQERQEVQDFKYQEQIKEMVKQIARVSGKDNQLKREILSICGLKVDDVDTASLTLFPLVSPVSTFLRSCCEIKLALHRVAEFTFVLLQDAPDSVDKRRTLRLANDLSSYCIFIKSILETGQRQDIRTVVRRLADIQIWTKRALTILLSSVNKLKC